MTNLQAIKRGATWSFSIRSWVDKEKTNSLDLTQFSFVLIATNAAGATILSLDDSDFVQVSDEERRVTLSKTETQALPIGELAYQIDVTNSDTTSDEWMRGYVNVIP